MYATHLMHIRTLSLSFEVLLYTTLISGAALKEIHQDMTWLRSLLLLGDTDVVTYVVTSRHDYVRNVLWINKYEHAFKMAW